MSNMIGEAKVYGVNGTLIITGVASTDNDPQKLSLTDDFDIAEARNKTGDVKTRAAHNRRHSITVTILWKDDAGSPSQSGAVGKVRFPDPLAKVTLGGFASNTVLNGDWNYEGGSAEFSNDGYCTGTFKLSRYGDTPAVMSTVS